MIGLLAAAWACDVAMEPVALADCLAGYEAEPTPERGLCGPFTKPKQLSKERSANGPARSRCPWSRWSSNASNGRPTLPPAPCC